MKTQIKLSPAALSNMLNHLETEYPNEGCGFLFGSDSNVRNVILVQPVKNEKTENRKRRFEINPLDYMKAEKYALDNDISLLGIYHSHPDHPARPSEHDLKQAVPFFSYIIVSVEKEKAKKITSWRLNESEIFENEEVTNIY